MDQMEALVVLGLGLDATPDQITSAYRKKALHFHPDTNQGEGSHAEMVRVNEAYEELKHYQPSSPLWASGGLAEVLNTS